MCTVSYVPTDKGFIFTSNRDELENRDCLAPKWYNLNYLLCYPKDTQAQGTWIACTPQGKVACLLNGAFVKHVRKNNYRKSRGLIVLESFDFASFSDFVEQIDLQDIEPFTLVLVENENLIELKWDGEQKYIQYLHPQNAHIWSSATLYPKTIAQKKEQFFKQNLTHLANPILQIHQSKPFENANENFISDFGNGLKTVSITQITVEEKQVNFAYYPII